MKLSLDKGLSGPRILFAVIALVSFIFFVNIAAASGTFITAPNRIDMVYSAARDTLYITDAGSVLRYRVGAASFDTPIQIGGNLYGIDISPDGNYLAIADSQRTDSAVWIYLVNLTSNDVQKISFTRAFYEGGTFAVAYLNNNKIIITSRFEGSGWVPLRLYDTSNGSITSLGDVRQDSMVTASGDGLVIGFTESNISDGRFGKYLSETGTILRKQHDNGTGWFNYEIGVNYNGSQLAIPTYGGTFFYDINLNKISTIGTYAGAQPISIAYHPVENIFYSAWAGTSEVRVHDATTFTQLNSYNFENNFTHVGNHAFVEGRTKLSPDGSLLFVTVTGGVRILRLYNPLTAKEQSVKTVMGNAINITLTGSVGNGATVTYKLNSMPINGTLTQIDPGDTSRYRYVPNPNYYGNDLFTFQAQYGRAVSAPAVVYITVQNPNRSPVAVNDTATVIKNSAVSIPVLNNDYDPDKDPLTIISVTNGKYGGTSISGSNIIYTPRKGFVGKDSFSYTISDGKGATASASVNITVKKPFMFPSILKLFFGLLLGIWG